MENLIFGPIPSRRLGKSLGINNIPHKVCSYSCAYLAIPTRPPAFKNILPAMESVIAMAYEIFSRNGIHTEHLTGYEGNAFSSTGNFIDDMLSITAVHPMREEAVNELMEKSNATLVDLNQLIELGRIEKISYNKQAYFLRKFHSKN
jgi:wyosine [tRNA(Phe)-imidazoG37] synthetase (radical SAM superfamily)